jgi:hypothetical protein
MEAAEVPPALQARLGAEGAASLLALLEMARQEWTVDVTTASVERFERRFTEESAGLRIAIAQSEASLRKEMGERGSGLRKEMSDLRVGLLKWSSAFWIGQVIATAGIAGVVIQALRS